MLAWEHKFEPIGQGYVLHFARLPQIGKEWSMCEQITVADAKRIIKNMGPADLIIGWQPDEAE